MLSQNEPIILGVSGWLAKRLDLKIDQVRIGFLIAVILGGAGILLYLILALIKSSKNE